MRNESNLSTFTMAGANNKQQDDKYLPHRGSLCQVVKSEREFEQSYIIHIEINEPAATNDHDAGDLQSSLHELLFNRHDFEFASRVFAILDSDSTSIVDRETVREFVYRRCPVFWRRDDDLIQMGLNYSIKNHQNHAGPEQGKKLSHTFDEIWQSVVKCSRSKPNSTKKKSRKGTKGSIESVTHLGLEGWMVFFRFIALAQYLEAKRRFSARHLQQTMRHRNSRPGSEMVVVDVPPAEPPAPLTPWQLSRYEQSNRAPLPAPELDLDHSMLAAHDSHNNHFASSMPLHFVKISMFGSPATPQGQNGLEFAVSFCRDFGVSSSDVEEVVVRRSMADMKWLDETFTSHKVLGGTLCGRILPPFPGSPSAASKILTSHFHNDDSNSAIVPSTLSIAKSTGSSAINAAVNSASIIRDVAKSFLGGFLTTSTKSIAVSRHNDDNNTHHNSPSSFTTRATQTYTATKSFKPKPSSHKISNILPENYYNPNSPTGKARQLERYLNYLLEHQALSTSFPLNTILKASQSGVEAAKQCLEECSRASKEIKDRTPQLVDGLVGTPNFGWVRTAAQAAIALKVHGILETSGLPSASARLQHASLPSFGNALARSNSGWEDIDVDTKVATVQHNLSADKEAGSNFEEGVVNDDGFDLLPLPVPAPERRILSAGSKLDAHRLSDRRQEERFHYGTHSTSGRFALFDDDEIGIAYLGDVAVDENIDKLREVIGSVDNTLSRCLACSGGIGKAHLERMNLHLGIVGGLDAWAGMRGKFVSQRPLLKGVAGIEQSKAVMEEGDLALIDDLCWQTSLASSAVSAAEDARAAVRASRTAANARATASSAALSAQQALEKGEFRNIEEARAAQTRASIAQSHAIHAAVVEHEAKTVKRRATLALAHDVKTWNVHRKREMLHSCLTYAKSQHEACRRAVDSWSSLADGFIGSTSTPTAVDRRRVVPSPLNVQPQSKRPPRMDPDEVNATIYENGNTVTIGALSHIVAVDHNVLSYDTVNALDVAGSVEVQSPETFLPSCDVGSIPEEEEETLAFVFPELRDVDWSQQRNNSQDFVNCTDIKCTNTDSKQKNTDDAFMQDFLDFNMTTDQPSVEQHQNQSDLFASNSGLEFDFNTNEETDGVIYPLSMEDQTSQEEDVVGDLRHFKRGHVKHDTSSNEEVLSESMQSLVEGLMSWGGGFDVEEEHFALPPGMATSIVLEGSTATGI